MSFYSKYNFRASNLSIYFQYGHIDKYIDRYANKYMVFTTEGFLKVAVESWTEWD